MCFMSIFFKPLSPQFPSPLSPHPPQLFQISKSRQLGDSENLFFPVTTDKLPSLIFFLMFYPHLFEPSPPHSIHSLFCHFPTSAAPSPDLSHTTQSNLCCFLSGFFRGIYILKKKRVCMYVCMCVYIYMQNHEPRGCHPFDYFVVPS